MYFILFHDKAHFLTSIGQECASLPSSHLEFGLQIDFLRVVINWAVQYINYLYCCCHDMSPMKSHRMIWSPRWLAQSTALIGGVLRTYHLITLKKCRPPRWWRTRYSFRCWWENSIGSLHNYAGWYWLHCKRPPYEAFSCSDGLIWKIWRAVSVFIKSIVYSRIIDINHNGNQHLSEKWIWIPDGLVGMVNSSRLYRSCAAENMRSKGKACD